MAFITVLLRGSALMGAILLAVALLKRLIIMVGFLLALVKFAIKAPQRRWPRRMQEDGWPAILDRHTHEGGTA